MTHDRVEIIEQLTMKLDKMNRQIIKIDKRIKRIPFAFLRNYFYKKYLKVMALRDEIFRELRDETKKRFPEKIMGAHNDTPVS